VTMECKFCGEHIPEIDWKQQIENGKYIAKYPSAAGKGRFT